MAERSVTSFSTTIQRPPDVVFDYLADVSRHAEWSPKPFHVDRAPGRVEVGDTFSSIGTMPYDKNHRNDVTVSECTAPTRLVLDAVDRGEHFVNTFHLEQEGTGTRLVRTLDSPKPSFPVSLVFPLIMLVFIRPDVERGLRALKATLERS
jgi:uncharacterized protein YndB with AHSA1/START domain